MSVLLAGMAPAIAAGEVIYVDADASVSGNGQSWGTAYKYLQDALYKPPTSGDQIWVAVGTYKPDEDEGGNVDPNDRTETFQLINGVAIYGGFPSGGETNLDEWDWQTNETILSGDINTPGDNSDDSYHVVTGSGTNSTAILDGFTITAGNANGSHPNDYGGGMFNDSGSPTVTNCTFSGNVADAGGGMNNFNGSSPTLSNCTFSGNVGRYGGGMFNYYSSPTLTNCTFSGNSSGRYGGGMYSKAGSPTVTNCTFSGNSAGSVAGGTVNVNNSEPNVIEPMFIYCTGGGMCNENSSPTVTNCTFSGNSTGQFGGGMYNQGNSPAIVNCTFSGNSAVAGGGGMANNISSNPTLTNCAFSGNSDDKNGGGMYNFNDSSPTVTNCIFWGDTAPTGPEIYNYDIYSTAIVSYSDIEDGYGGTGNINAAPCFVDADGPDDVIGTEDDNLRLLAGSLCIDAGDNTAVPGGVTTDLDGNPRFVDDPDTTDTGNPPGADAIVDMGAYEYQPVRTLTISSTSGGTVTVPGEGSFQYDHGTVVQIIAQHDTYYHFVEWTGTVVDAGKVENPSAASTTVTVDVDYTLVANFARTIIYVDADAPEPTHDGFTWTDAYLYLQDALAAAGSGSEIWVVEGAYKPDQGSGQTPGDRTATFQLINGVAIKGGYAGFGEPDPNERNIELHETILSGDLDGNDVQGLDPCDLLDEPTRGENSYHVVTGSGNTGTAVLNGFTITAGNARYTGGDLYPYDCGGGMYNGEYSSPTVVNCTFSRNSAVDVGGGMSNYNNSGPTVMNCTFSGNSAACDGGGMDNENSSPMVSNCAFIGNSATGDSWGGGMCNANKSSPTVTNCTFSGNTAYYGGGMYNDTHNGDGSNPTLTNCILWGNTAPTGPQIYTEAGSSPTVSYSDVQDGWPGMGNIDEDPLFIGLNGLDGIPGTADDEEDDVHLRGYSPCINAGDPGGDYSGQVDIDRRPRVAYGRVDMGADEVFPAAGDFEPDGDVDFADFAIFAGNWLLGVSN